MQNEIHYEKIAKYKQTNWEKKLQSIIFWERESHSHENDLEVDHRKKIVYFLSS